MNDNCLPPLKWYTKPRLEHLRLVAERAGGIALLEFRPDDKRFGRGAPLRGNAAIVEAADLVLAFWDGKSRGTLDAVAKARKLGKACWLPRQRRARRRQGDAGRHAVSWAKRSMTRGTA